MPAAKSHLLEIEGCEVSVTNLDKMIYPSGFTKGQAIEFYIRISNYLLPHLKGRPVTLKRYPNGVTGAHFYQKDAPKYTPNWVPRFPVPRRSGSADICYVLIDHLAALVWSVNLANLEIHPFLHRVPHLDIPTAMLFDLDPGDGAGILESAGVAFLLKDTLDGAGLRSFAKVSGSKGIQVFVPLNTQVHYAETKLYARSLAERLESVYPKLVISSMSKEKRKGKVLIDWSQNSGFKTTVAPYSLRAKSALPYVSMPVKWEELARAATRGTPDALYFTPDQAIARVSKEGDLFAPLLSLREKISRVFKHAKKNTNLEDHASGARQLRF